MAKQLRFSRWRRLPGAHRITERKLPDHRTELQRLTLYLPGAVLDHAESQASQAGAASVQAYCEGLLRELIEAKARSERLEQSEARRALLEGLDAIANDPDYLAEWSAVSVDRPAGNRSEPLDVETAEPGLDDAAEAVDAWEPGLEAASWPMLRSLDVNMPEDEGGPGAIDPVRADDAPTIDDLELRTAAVVFRHAGLNDEDPTAFLPTLRRGEAVAPESARELVGALIAIERQLGKAPTLDRRLAYALHRLAFEGQVLLTDAWPTVASDQATVDVLRIVQEAVDRILSGEDIRYYQHDPSPEPPP